jgi:AcrR family transcriptional regulator
VDVTVAANGDAADNRAPESSAESSGVKSDAGRNVRTPDGSARDWRSRVVRRALGPAHDKAERRGRAFIMAASRLIEQAGAADLTMQKVATEAGLSLRALYQHFEGKDDLLVALIEETQVVFARLIDRHIASYSDPLERLGAALYFATDVRQHRDPFARNPQERMDPHYNAALTTFSVQMSITAPDRLADARRPVIDLFLRLIEDAIAAGEIEEEDSQLMASQLFFAYDSYLVNINLGNSISTPLPTNESLVRFVVQGLGAPLPEGWEQQFRDAGAEPLAAGANERGTSPS